MSKIITVLGQKGGDGKSTVACHLAYAAREAGKRVLVIDFDTQGNASQFLSQDLRINKRRGGSEQIFGDNEIQYTDVVGDGMKLLHGHGYLEELDERKDEILRGGLGKKLRPKVRALPFDIIIFDTPPSIGPRIVASLFWSDLALVVIKPKLSSMTGLDSTIDTIRAMQKLNPGLAMRMVVNDCKRSKTENRKREELTAKFGKVIVQEFSSRVAVSDAMENFMPVWTHSRDKKLGTEWKDFAARMLDFKV